MITDPKKYVKTGIPGLDPLLGRGIMKESVITLSGPTGCGKSSFAMQFLVEGALQFQEPGLYISLEDSKNSILSHMSLFKWDLHGMEAKKQLIFLDYPIYEVGQFLEKENAIGEIINTMNIERVVIDSIMPIALSFKENDERKRGFINLLSNLRRWKTTTLVVAEDTTPDPTIILPRTTYEFEKLADGWLHIYYIRDEKGSRERAIEVIKMKGTNYITKIFKLGIAEEGFTVSDKPISLKDLRR